MRAALQSRRSCRLERPRGNLWRGDSPTTGRRCSARIVPPSKAINDGRPITPATEWLVDNYHLVEKQIHEIHSDLPPGYYRQLPKLAAGPFAGYPRVFGIAWAFVAHTDSRFDSEMLVRFVRAYQEVQPLTIGELWAVSITLRIVLVENLGRLARQITNSRAERQRADGLADRLLGAGGVPAESVAIVLVADERRPLSQAFAVQLVHRLRDQDPRITPALTWLDERLAIQDTTTDAVVRDVHRQQGAANVSVRNIITSLRLISDVDWKQLFERLSLVDAVLATGGDFESMDFPTRTLYRSAVEELSRGSNRTELDIASAAVLAAKQAEADAPATEQARRRDTGYILLAGGRRAFEKTIAYRLPMRNWAARLNRSLGVGGYVTAISLVAAILLAAPLLVLSAAGSRPRGSWPAWRARRHSRDRRRGCVGQSRGQPRLCCDPSAGSGATGWSALAPAHACRRADVAHDAGQVWKS